MIEGFWIVFLIVLIIGACVKYFDTAVWLLPTKKIACCVTPPEAGIIACVVPAVVAVTVISLAFTSFVPVADTAIRLIPRPEKAVVSVPSVPKLCTAIAGNPSLSM